MPPFEPSVLAALTSSAESLIKIAERVTAKSHKARILATARRVMDRIDAELGYTPAVKTPKGPKARQDGEELVVTVTEEFRFPSSSHERRQEAERQVVQDLEAAIAAPVNTPKTVDPELSKRLSTINRDLYRADRMPVEPVKPEPVEPLPVTTMTTFALLGMNPYLIGNLHKADLFTVGDIVNCTFDELVSIDYVGELGAKYLRQKMKNYGFALVGESLECAA
ncbi:MULTISPECIES: hypothetical protein [Pseudomonas]|uniref:Uncharacterized protein n=1 Tax=Pseudomonas lutea TaxID=243924 RepID=A0A9X8MH58_9PSED|nr:MULTISPECIES: hypothetical protein [Pseudomonas]SER37152.1 hypothetical protein SAMN05216409_11883 [Pseudomonas lutea]